MVLRKPYGFLIKHFRLIHLIITGLLLYIASKYREIYVYLGKCISDIALKYDAGLYIKYGVFFFIIITCLLLFLIYWLLKYKDKPRKIYIFSIIGNIICAIILIFVFNYLGGFGSKVISQKTLRLYRDIMFIVNIFQSVLVVIMLIRGLGFNIKKFDFEKDVQELNLVNSDNEEVEVNIGIDTTNLARGVRKQGREFGYFFKEYKVYIIVILVALALFLGYKGINYFKDKFKIYNENEYVGLNNYIKILDSYYSVLDDDSYVIVKFSTFKKGRRDKLNSGNLVLNIDNKKYTPDKNICHKFNYIGNCYKQQFVSNEETDYIITYKVDELNVNKVYLDYVESYNKKYRIKLKLENKENN